MHQYVRCRQVSCLSDVICQSAELHILISSVALNPEHLNTMYYKTTTILFTNQWNRINVLKPLHSVPIYFLSTSDTYLSCSREENTINVSNQVKFNPNGKISFLCYINIWSKDCCNICKNNLQIFIIATYDLSILPTI